MTNNDDLALKLKAAAEKAISDEGPGWWNERQLSHETGPIIHQADVKFIAAASPANILSLLAERDADKEEIATLQSRNRRLEGIITAAEKRIANMQAIAEAAEKLVRCKGRYHSEQNYRAMAALFGVTTPDLTPLETEALTMSVKLPDRDDFWDEGVFLGIEYADAVNAALTDAGINLEGGE